MEASDSDSTRLRRIGREAALQAMVFAGWLLAFAAAALLEYAPHASLWFPPAAVSFAAVLVLGIRVLPVLWLACILVTVLSETIDQNGLNGLELVLAGLAFGFTHTLAYGAVAWFLRRGAFYASPVTTLRKVSWFLLAGAAAAGLSSLFGGISLAVTGMIEFAAVPELIAPWWIGDYAGLVTVAPAFTLLLARTAENFGLSIPQGVRRLLGREPIRALFPRAAGKLGFMLGLASIILIAAALFPGQQAMVFLLFVCLIVQLWVVHSESELAALLGILLFSALMAVAAGLMGLGDQALMLQFLVIALAVSSYLGLAVPALYRDNTRMRQLLTHDGLTGALTRSFFEDAAVEALRNAFVKRQPVCLLMVDLDGLKPINDRHGHAAGDIALKTLAEVCARNLAPGQLLGRLSGDEFAMLLVGCDRVEAGRVVDAIREELGACPPVAERDQVAASFGIAELDSKEGGDFRQLLARADQAMYADKRR